MRKQKALGFASAAMATVVLASCGGLGKMEKKLEEIKLTVTPDPVQVDGDSIAISVSATIPPKYFHKKVVADFTPVLIAEDGSELKFDTKTLQGEAAAGNGEVVSFTEGKTVTYTSKVAYSSSFEVADLQLKVTGTMGKKSKEFEGVKFGDGTITTAYLVQSDDKVIMANDQFVRITNHTQDAEVHYQVSRSVVRPGELRDQDMKDLQNFLKTAAADDKINIKGLTNNSYASPEGEQSKNQNLSDQRAESGSKAVMRMIARNKIKTGEGFVTNVGKGEDWAGFKSAMNASDIADKELIIRTLEMYPSGVKREMEIKNLSKTYKEVEEKILPKLRRSQISVSYEVVGKSDEELKTLSKSNPDTLNVEELLYSATLTNDLNEKLAIYQAAERIYPNDWRGINNVGYIYMMQNKLADAETQFNKAKEVNSDAVVINNLGVVSRLKGDRKKAAEMYNEAMSAGKEVSYNMGIVNIQDGDYASAVTNMGSENTFNKALAQTLAGDHEGALKTIEASDDKETAMGFYLKAIIGARQGNKDLMLNNLKSAISKDSTLKEKAAKDREFIKYFEDADFQSTAN